MEEKIFHHPRIDLFTKKDNVLENMHRIMPEARKIEKGEKMSFVSDAFWKVMFLNSKRIKYTCILLSCIINVEYEELLKNLKLVSTEFNRDNLKSKAERGDYVAELNGKNICIEVNNSASTRDYSDVNLRNLEYAYHKLNEKVEEGKPYKFTDTLLINLHNFYYEGIDDWYQVYTINDGEGILYTDKLIILNLYLPKLKELCYTKEVDELDELERVLLTFYSENIEKSKEFGKDIKVMEEYVDEAEKISNDKELKEVYDMEYEYTNIGFERGMQKGNEQGLEQGLEQGQLLKQQEIARNMLKDNVDIETIAKYTNLTIEEINSLKKDTEK